MRAIHFLVVFSFFLLRASTGDGNYIFVDKWGSTGTGDGQFDSPSGMVKNQEGNFLIVDHGNCRIQKYDVHKTFLGWFGGCNNSSHAGSGHWHEPGSTHHPIQGGGPGQFWYPTAIVSDSLGRIYVADPHNQRIQMFASDWSHLCSFGSYGSGPGQFSLPTFLALDSQDNLYVSDTHNWRVQKFKYNGVSVDYIKQWPGNAYLGGIAIDADDMVYVVEGNPTYTVKKFNTEGDLQTSWGGQGTDPGQFLSWPTTVAIGPSDGLIYVGEPCYNDVSRIQTFTPEGVYVDGWGSHGTGDGQFGGITNIFIDPSSDLIYVGDARDLNNAFINDRIQVFKRITGMVFVSISDPGFIGEMSKYETTNAQYCQFLNDANASGQITVYNNNVYATSDTSHAQPYYNLAGAGDTTDGVTNGGAARINYTGSSFTVDSGFENHPVTYVSWYGATAFCNYYDYRLPTIQEWQTVADYDGTYTYGCGTTITSSMANYQGSNHPNGTTAVGAFGTFGYGLCDMAGNVEENLSDGSGNTRYGLGGGWLHHAGYCDISYTTVGARISMYSHVGFRVCRNITVEPEEIVWVSVNDPGVSGHEGFNGQMSKYETTNAQYCEFLNAAMDSNEITVYTDNIVYAMSDTSHAQPYYNLAGAGYTYDNAANGGAARINYTNNLFTVDPGFENHPVTSVSWYGATAFCNYYGWRLPTEWEWQAVADYNDGRPYACGTSINNSIANYTGSIHPDGTNVVGSFGDPAGYGYGMYDMAGNVWEWTQSISSGIYRALRGGSWYCVVDHLTVSDWIDGNPPVTYGDVGFRVCRNVLDDIEWVYIDDPGVSGHEGFTGYMGKHEITNYQYCQYLNAANASDQITVDNNNVYATSDTSHAQPYYNLAGTGSTFNGVTNGGAARINYSGGSFTVDSSFEDHPVTYVSWYGAIAFCNYYGYRLPTEWEWQAVADYDGSFNYGCGTTINNNTANYLGSIHPDGTTVVGVFGTYGYGMCDMAGNVWEWTSSIYSDSYRVVRGGAWGNNDSGCAILNWSYYSPSISYRDFGFRVCRDVVIESEQWRYWKGTQEPPSHWKDISFDDSSWLLGSMGIGYGDDDDATVLDDMQGHYVSVYVRRPFHVSDPALLTSLLLTIDYDDAFVAYLNGVEVARNNVNGNPPAFNVLANEPHEAATDDTNPNPPEDYDLTVFKDQLVAGTNILAIQGHNGALNDDDFSLIPALFTVVYVDDDSLNDPGPRDPSLSDLAEDGTKNHPFDTIQEAIEAAQPADTVLVRPGIYGEEFNFNQKALTVRSADEPAVLECPGQIAVSFDSGEGAESILQNFIIKNNSIGILVESSSPTIRNVTVVNNQACGIAAYFAADPDISNSIFWNNRIDLLDCQARYSWVQSEAIPLPDLVSYWRFAEGSGTSALDLIGSNHGSIAGAIWAPGQVGGALEFDGQGDYIKIPDDDSLTPRDSISLSFWLYNRGGQTAGIYKYAGCPDEPSSPGDSSAYYVEIRDPNYDTGKILWRIFSSSLSSDGLYSNRIVSLNTWHHIAVTFDKGTAAIYLDGQLDKVAMLSVSSIMNDVQPLYMGGFWSYCDQDAFRNRLHGRLDEVAMYNRALSLLDVQQIYQNGLEGYDLQNLSDPLFVDPNQGDFHLKSQGWRWVAPSGGWTWDEQTSPCIDAGNPGTAFGREPRTLPRDPDHTWGVNVRVDMGAYGGTAYASMGPPGWALLADLNNDGTVNLEDFAAQGHNWLLREGQQPGDLNRDRTVDLPDLILLVQDWLAVTTWYP